jgi:putative peptidoglycan lipid II flippase
LFQRGEFNIKAVQLTAQALLYYAIGLWAFSAVRIVAATFFALKDTRTPMIMAAISISANIVLGIILMRPLAHGGLALATSLASILNLGLLGRALRVKLGRLGWRNITLSACRTLLSAGVMGIVVWGAAFVLIPPAGGRLIELLLGLIGSVIVGLIIFGTFSYSIKSPEFVSVVAEVKKGLSKK